MISFNPLKPGVAWASCQIRKTAGCACTGNAGKVLPRRRFQRKPLVSNPGIHHGTCVTHVPWCMSGSLTCGDGETFPAFPAHAHPQFCVSGKRPMYTSLPTVIVTNNHDSEKILFANRCQVIACANFYSSLFGHFESNFEIVHESDFHLRRVFKYGMIETATDQEFLWWTHANTIILYYTDSLLS